MNIWSWVHSSCFDLYEEGHFRLAELMTELPSAVCDGDHEQAEAMVAEALPLARAIEKPWLEIFLRHWLAQSRILYRRDVTQGLSEVVSLFEFANREQNQDCPQSVCVSQDVCSAYGVLDGPGFGEERLKVSTETLSRINSNWPCYACISAEHSSALMDLGRYEQAQAFCEAQLAQLGNDASQPRLVLAEALYAQAKYKEAVSTLNFKVPSHAGRKNRQRQRLLRTMCFLQLDKVQQALAQRISVSNLSLELSPSEFVMFAQCELLVCQRAPEAALNDLDRQLIAMRDQLRASGALFDQVQLSLTLLELALLHANHSAAAQYRADIEALAPMLRQPQFALDPMRAVLARYP